jgi:hypothetical protein
VARARTRVVALPAFQAAMPHAKSCAMRGAGGRGHAAAKRSGPAATRDVAAAATRRVAKKESEVSR